MAYATVLNTLLQAYFFKFMLSGVSFNTFTDDINAYRSGTNYFTGIPVSRNVHLQMSIPLTVGVFFEALFPEMISRCYLVMSRNRMVKQAGSGSKSVNFIKRAFLGLEVNFSQNYSKLEYVLVICIGFSTGAPVLALIGLIYVIILYFMERGLFLADSKVPYFLGSASVKSAIWAGFWGILIRIFVSLFALSDTSVFPAQANLLSMNLSTLVSAGTSTTLSDLFTRWNNLLIHLILLICWILFMIIFSVVNSVLSKRRKKLKAWIARELKFLEPFSEADEIANNILAHKPKVESYTNFSYSIFKNPEYYCLKTHFSSEIPNEDPKKLVIEVGDKSKPKKPGEKADPSEKTGENKDTAKAEGEKARDPLKKNTVAPANKKEPAKNSKANEETVKSEEGKAKEGEEKKKPFIRRTDLEKKNPPANQSKPEQAANPQQRNQAAGGPVRVPQPNQFQRGPNGQQGPNQNWSPQAQFKQMNRAPFQPQPFNNGRPPNQGAPYRPVGNPNQNQNFNNQRGQNLPPINNPNNNFASQSNFQNNPFNSGQNPGPNQSQNQGPQGYQNSGFPQQMPQSMPYSGPQPVPGYKPVDFITGDSSLGRDGPNRNLFGINIGQATNPNQRKEDPIPVFISKEEKELH